MVLEKLKKTTNTENTNETPQETPGNEAQNGKKKKKEKPKKTLGQEIMSWVWTLLCALLIATLIRAFVAEPVRVDGTSMTNTLMDGEIVLVSKLAYGEGTKGMERGDVVICRYPNRTEGSFHLGAALSLESHTIFVKRMVALPGDTVEISGGILYVNGQATPNPEKMGSIPSDYPLRLLGPDEYFMIGDNRYTSHDSRASDVGPISRDMIMGRVECVVFPFSNWRTVE